MSISIFRGPVEKGVGGVGGVVCFSWCHMGNVFHPCSTSRIKIVAVTLSAQKASKQLTRFPCRSACHLMVRCGGYWHSGVAEVELRSLLNQMLLGEGACLKASYSRRAYVALFRFLLL